MFEKLVAIEPVSLIPSAEEELHAYAKEVVLYPDIPADEDEIVRRIGDADAVLLGPQIRFSKDKIAAELPGVPVEAIDMRMYGRMDGKGTVELAEKIMKG